MITQFLDLKLNSDTTESDTVDRSFTMPSSAQNEAQSDLSSCPIPGGFGDDIEFSATVAAGIALAGLIPLLSPTTPRIIGETHLLVRKMKAFTP